MTEHSDNSNALPLDTLSISDYINTKRIQPLELNSVDFIILKEDSKTMYAEIDKVVYSDENFYIGDFFGGRRVVSFDNLGNPVASFGKRGNGPGEYVLPIDLCVTQDFVYILDSPQRKLLRYNKTGEFIDSKEVPFRCNGFVPLNNGNFLFNISANVLDNNSQICLTDSTLTPLKFSLQYPEGYVDSWFTNNSFRITDSEIVYYSSPCDTIYTFDLNGELAKKTVLNFRGGSLPKEAKLNFSKYDDFNELESGMHLRDNPLITNSGLRHLDVADYNHDYALRILLDSKGNILRSFDFGSNMSFKDIITDCIEYHNGNIVSYLSAELAQQCMDYDELPDSIKTALNDGNRVLVIHNLQQKP
jgi:hypothetical protein